MIKKCVQFSLTSFGPLKYDCVVNTIEIFNFLPQMNNLVTTGLHFLLLIISYYVFYLDCIVQYFYKHLAYHLSIQ